MSTSDCLEKVTCNGCGITFVTSKDYKIHRLTFCKQSSLSGGRCPVCNTTGPRCICQQHWARTYGLVSGLYEKPTDDTYGLTQLAGISQLCATMQKCKLVTVEEQPVVKPYNPIQLKGTVWDKQIAMLPKRQGDSAKPELYDNRIMDMSAEASKIAKELGITVELVPHTLQLTTDSPRSIMKDHSVARKKFKTCIRDTGFDPQTAVHLCLLELLSVDQTLCTSCRS